MCVCDWIFKTDINEIYIHDETIRHTKNACKINTLMYRNFLYCEQCFAYVICRQLRARISYEQLNARYPELVIQALQALNKDTRYEILKFYHQLPSINNS